MSFLRAALVCLALAARVFAQPAPAAAQADALTVTDGGPARPLSALLDGPAIVHLWATWCAPCREELPDLAAFLAREPGLAGHVLVLSVDTAPVARVKDFLDQLGIPLPPRKIAAGNAGAAFGVRGYPATVFLAANGSLVRLHAGPLDWGAASVRTEVAAHLSPP